jgi:hypothetical protein
MLTADPANSGNNFCVFSIGNTPYFQILKNDYLVHYVSRSYLESFQFIDISNHIMNRGISIRSGIISTNTGYIDIRAETDVREQIAMSKITFFRQHDSYIVYGIGINNNNTYMIHPNSPSPSPISDTIYYVDKYYYLSQHEHTIVQDILNNTLSRDSSNPTRRRAQPVRPAQPARPAQTQLVDPADKAKSAQCPVCKESSNFVKMFKNILNRCILCSNKSEEIYVSYCDHMYCETCFNNSDIQEMVFTKEDPSRLCNNQDKNVIECPSCRGPRIKFNFNFKYEDKCNICLNVCKGMMLGCCGHSICLMCFINCKNKRR